MRPIAISSYWNNQEQKDLVKASKDAGLTLSMYIKTKVLSTSSSALSDLAKTEGVSIGDIIQMLIDNWNNPISTKVDDDTVCMLKNRITELENEIVLLKSPAPISIKMQGNWTNILTDRFLDAKGKWVKYDDLLACVGLNPQRIDEQEHLQFQAALRNICTPDTEYPEEYRTGKDYDIEENYSRGYRLIEKKVN